MNSTTLKVGVAGQHFYLACRRREKFCIGSAEDCKLSLDVDGIAEEHCEVERISEDEFILRPIDKAPVSVNGIRAEEMTVASPFRLRLADWDFEVELVPDKEAEGTERVKSEAIEDGRERKELVVGKKKKRALLPLPPVGRTESKSKRQQKTEPVALFSTPRSETPKSLGSSQVEKMAASGANLFAAIPALRFADLADGFYLADTPKQSTGAAPGGSVVAVALPNTDRPLKTVKPREAVTAASSKFFGAALSLLVVVAVLGQGWFWWRAERLPHDPVRLAELVGKGDTSAMSMLGVSKLRGERGSDLDIDGGYRLLVRAGEQRDALALAAMAWRKEIGFEIPGETRSADQLRRDAVRLPLAEAVEGSRDERLNTLAALSTFGTETDLFEEILRDCADAGDPLASLSFARDPRLREASADWWELAEKDARKLERKGSLFGSSIRSEILLAPENPNRDPDLGRERLESAASRGDARSQYWLALELEKSGKSEEAFRMIRRAERVSFLPARATLARFHLEGIGTSAARSAAMALVENCETSHPDTNFLVAEVLVQADQSGRELERAEGLLRPLVSENYPRAVAALSEVLVRQNRLIEAEPLLRRAASEEDPSACLALGKILASSRDPERLEEAVEWLEIAAEAGEPEASVVLAEVVDHPDRQYREPGRAVELLLSLLDQGHTEGLVRLGRHYLDGRGVEKDGAKALLYLDRATKAGMSDAWYPLGLVFETGVEGTVLQSDRNAINAFTEAIKAGDSSAIERFSIASEAREWLSRFAEAWESDDYRASLMLIPEVPESYLHLDDPSATLIAALEEGWRASWPERNVSLLASESGSDDVFILESLDRILVKSRVRFRVSRGGSVAQSDVLLEVAFQQMTTDDWKIISVNQSGGEWQLSPSEAWFSNGRSSHTILPARPADSATLRLTDLAPSQVQSVRVLPFEDRFGSQWAMVPNTITDDLVIFSRTDSEGDQLVPLAYFSDTQLSRIEAMVDGQSFDDYEAALATVLITPDRDDPKTSALLRRAESGDANAAAQVGGAYYDGLEGFPYNRIEALKWFVKASRAQDPVGKLWIAVMTDSGEIQSDEPVKKTFEDAVVMLAPIVGGGSQDPVYLRATGEAVAGAEQITLDSSSPRKLLEMAAERGDLRAKLLLGETLLERSPLEGVRYLRFASDARCGTAALSLAKYYLGKGNDPRLAPDLLASAAEKGVPEAQFLLGSCFARGIGVEQSLEMGAFWIQLGMEGAIREADKDLEVRIRTAIRDADGSEFIEELRKAERFFEQR
ncbi:MAG: hypothetical protein AAF236_02060 [Verrucomicrobiota bacterium]